MPKQLQETAVITEAAATAAASSGRLLVQLIDQGWGSSGYYSADCLEAAATDRVFPAGTHMYLDHPTESETYERPERSVRDLAAVLATDAWYQDGALVGEARVFGPFREGLVEMKDSIGASIRASAEVTEGGTAAGRRGRIINRLVESQSVDFVTKAGRGGKILDVLESARTTVVEKAVAHGVSEATANEIRDNLDTVLRDAFGGEKSWVWVQDFDDTHVWYQHDTPDECATYQIAYSLADDGAVTLAGDPVEVRRHTTYVPATRSDSTTTTTESQEDTMPKIEIDEAEHSRLLGLAGRVDALEAERDTEKARADEAVKKLAEAVTPPKPKSPRDLLEAAGKDKDDRIAALEARERARDIVREELAEAFLAPSTIARATSDLVTNLPIVEGKLDEVELRNRCVAQRDQYELEAMEALQAAGVGTPRSLGTTRAPLGFDAERAQAGLTESFKAIGLSDAAAETAVKGR